MKETIVVRFAPNFAARRFAATLLVLAMSVLGPLATGTPVLAHQWGGDNSRVLTQIKSMPI